MIDRYIIERQTTETGFQYALVETGFKPMTLGIYTSKLRAKESRAEWVARDDLQEKINDFFSEMLEKFSDRLDGAEIEKIIKEH